jgi:hypothetical protein
VCMNIIYKCKQVVYMNTIHGIAKKYELQFGIHVLKILIIDLRDGGLREVIYTQ